MRLHKNHLARAATDCFNADRARAREEIDEKRILYRWSEHVKQRLAQAVTRWAHAQFCRALQNAAAIFTCDHTHDLSLPQLFSNACRGQTNQPLRVDSVSAT